MLVATPRLLPLGECTLPLLLVLPQHDEHDVLVVECMSIIPNIVVVIIIDHHVGDFPSTVRY